MNKKFVLDTVNSDKNKVVEIWFKRLSKIRDKRYLHNLRIPTCGLNLNAIISRRFVFYQADYMLFDDY